MLERGVHVLQAFRPDGKPATLGALTARTGLPKPTVYRLAEELVELGLLERLPIGYRPGLALFELGELVPAKVDLSASALPFMQDLYEATHETVHLGIRDNLDVVYAEKIRGHGGVDVPSRVGGRLPLTSTGVGKALLAFSGPSVIEAVLSRPLRRLTEFSIKDRDRLLRELTAIRRVRMAVDREEAALGVSCIAVPIIVNSQAVAALSLTLPSSRMNAAGLEPTLRAVSLAFARDLSGKTAYLQDGLSQAGHPSDRCPQGGEPLAEQVQ